MSAINVALLGFGTVGQGVCEAIDTHQDRLKEVLGKEVKVKAILIKDPTKERNIESSINVTTDFQEILDIQDLHVIFEAIVGEEPSYTYLTQAIEKGIHIVTANKAMFAKYGPELLEEAKRKGVSVGFEATTAGGIPVIGSIRQLLKVNEIRQIQGILNGTSNFILSQMRKRGLAFETALKISQEKGYAEADPTNDIEGHDAFYKLLILSQTAFGRQPDWKNIRRKGISHLTAEWLQAAESFRLRFKHVGSLRRDSVDHIQGEVEPILVHDTHPFYGVEDVENAISLKGSLVGRITLLGPGAGKLPTGSAMVEDFLSLIERKYTDSAESTVNTGEVHDESSHNWVLRIRENDEYQNWLPSFILKDRIHLGDNLYVFVEGTKETLESLLRTHEHIQAVPILKEIPLENEVKTGAAVS
ncbi:homoserine dehydrogenase [Rossellomorea aquimaris]|uniref:Homoserine dehydrogenase n=1 Tax=Rossellomorea aquimaris TaxID=189382 RepID=A0A5D4U957_9BACI|nr:homoserine dehydrogenase [Rossellomorea aquimaris]TYS76706.1 homoserine dehydrogenase [Rossellomorea aquimaris]TYS83611.1 homoserine dehydrogenase [Rossellomorea aquimaris]TYS89160.1 homoserine dehydrogenase [Rossellomorea aquimaris]